MSQISKKVTFFRRNYFYIIGVVWLFLGVVLLVAKAYPFLSYTYTVLGLIYAGYAYFKKDLPREFIRWDDEKIEISEWQQSTKTYFWKDVDSIYVSELNLTIKSGVANGTMVALDNYSKAKIKKLRTALADFNSLAVV
ncbi:hypothetical protein SAMN05444483_12335 [Salegentibacter echinorum]|uniref:PH domain-containing protein n=1 Tax=Salegentibacter echinorum TaxID=1073325 RepID=A0A1M5M067_SALEC|nr:hypothetical protein [Salegentibacter echinorum]SHG70732.1 hypothetical protein SAMN05444483_12335 [Salegentibacter echinorum]